MNKTFFYRTTLITALEIAIVSYVRHYNIDPSEGLFPACVSSWVQAIRELCDHECDSLYLKSVEEESEGVANTIINGRKLSDKEYLISLMRRA